jgi:ATP-dependent exoDNAse (exonuclease V) beta subunit
MNPRAVLNLFQDKYGIIFEKNEWAELIEVLTIDKSKRSYHVNSIDKVKGLQASTCVFIIDNGMIQYLTRKKKTRNKEMNKLYVALTRSWDHLIFAVDRERITCMTKSEIQDWFEAKSIKAITTN